jgi:sialic acid synthase SpsE
MSMIGEVEEALAVLAFGYTDADTSPTRDGFIAAYRSEAGQARLLDRVVLLHCTSEYPTPPENVHLRAMDTLRHAFDLPVGYSDHTLGIAVPIAAAARGAAVLEKHFTLDRSMPGPDHRASLEPGELTAMVQAIREIEKALGRATKGPTPGEIEMRVAARRSLTAVREIGLGEEITELNMQPLRPCSGASPMEFWEHIGREAPRRYAPGEAL